MQRKFFLVGLIVALQMGLVLVYIGVSWIHREIRDAQAGKIDHQAYELIESGQPKEAIRFSRQAIVISPDDGDLHNNLGYALMVVGRLTESEQECRLAVQLAPQHSWCHDSLGQVLAREKKLDEAIVECRKAIELASPEEEAVGHNSLGYALYLSGEKESARYEWNTALQMGNRKEARRAKDYLARMP